MVFSLFITNILAIFTSFTIAILLGSHIIAFLKNLQGEGQPIRIDGPITHYAKKGTPTMGGILIIISGFLSQAIWCQISNPYIMILNATILCYGGLGFLDDYRKLKYRNTKGVSGKGKLIYQFVLAGIVSYLLLQMTISNESVNIVEDIINYMTSYRIPFIHYYYFGMSSIMFYLLFSSLIIVGSSNSVNLTDGLDGLSIVPITISLIFFVLLASNAIPGYSNIVFSKEHSAKISEISTYCSAFIGAGLGFLWFNTSPAKVFMGDVGSLSLGALLAVLSIILKVELFFGIVGLLFVIEAISVILQVGSFKLRKKRIFLMAPIHHHFEKLGWSENTVVMRFWIFSVMCFLIGILAVI